MTKHEQTSKKVAAIAGRILKQLAAAKVFRNATVFMLDGIPLCTMAELKAVCASCLTQAPAKKAKP